MARRARYQNKNQNTSSTDHNEFSGTFASWIAGSKPTHGNDGDDVAHVLLGKASDQGEDGRRTAILQLLCYNFKPDSLSELNVLPEEDVPVSMVVHPGVDGVILSFSKGCKFFELDGNSKLKVSDIVLSAMQDIGPQKCLAFSADGSKLATGGEDGHLRIFEWPSLQVLLDQPKAHSSFKDLDFSLDSAFLASTSNDGPARVWDIIKAAPLATLTRDQGESIDFCRFSRDGTKPFLFCTVTKGGKSRIAVWDITTWRKLGGKKFLDNPISAFGISQNGKFLSIGSTKGDISIIDVRQMQVQHSIKRAHPGAVITSIEFASNGRALLSVSPEWAARVNPIPCERDWKDWEIYLLLLTMVLISVILFYIFFEHSDSFWNFPLGREQPAKPPIEAILGDPVSSDDQNIW